MQGEHHPFKRLNHLIQRMYPVSETDECPFTLSSVRLLCTNEDPFREKYEAYQPHLSRMVVTHQMVVTLQQTITKRW